MDYDLLWRWRSSYSAAKTLVRKENLSPAGRKIYRESCERGLIPTVGEGKIAEGDRRPRKINN